MATTLLLPDRTADAGLAPLARAARNNRADPAAAEAYGLALLKYGRFDDATTWLERAIALDLTNSDYRVNLAAAHFARDRYDLAYEHALRAYELDPSSGLACMNIGSLHTFFQEPEAAAGWFRRAINLVPQHYEAWACWIFALDFLETTTPERALGARRALAEAWEAPIRPLWAPHAVGHDPERRLRIGVLSPDFRDHSAAYCYGPIYEHLDREQFELVSYADVGVRDAVTDWFERASNGWRDVSGWDDAMVARAIRQDHVDVLLDVAGFTDRGRLRVHMLKPAPLSVSAWGYLTGTGLAAMDGLIADDVLIPPEHERHYRERVLRVPYALGLAVFREDVPILPRPADRPLTFGYLGRLLKVSDGTIRLWSELLRRAPGSRLILKDGALRHARVERRIVGAFRDHGVDPGRIELRLESPRLDHLRAYNDIDVALEPLPQSGGTTTMEALWMGRPVVTMAGGRTASRAAASTLAAIGRPEWIARSDDEYLALAGRLADAGGAALRDRLLASPIFDQAGRTRAFEAAVRDLWRDWCAERRAA